MIEHVNMVILLIKYNNESDIILKAKTSVKTMKILLCIYFKSLSLFSLLSSLSLSLGMSWARPSFTAGYIYITRKYFEQLETIARHEVFNRVWAILKMLRTNQEKEEEREKEREREERREKREERR